MLLFRRFVCAALSFLLIASIVKATTVSECQAQIAALRVQTQSVTMTGRNADRDRLGLIGKLDNATLSIDKAKFCDAIQKLNDYKAKINQLIAANKINNDPTEGVTGDELLTDADAAITCIRELIVQSGGANCS